MGTKNTNNNETHDDMLAHRDTGTTQHTGTKSQYALVLFIPLETPSLLASVTVRTSSVPAALPVRDRGLGLMPDLPLHLYPDASPVRYWAPDLVWAFTALTLVLRAHTS